MRIVFMGTPDFAVASLRALVEGGYNVVGVITMPDKPAGRGHKLQASAVKEYAVSQGLPLLQPEKLKDEEFLQALKAWNADLQIVVAFRMLPEVVWNMPPRGTFNLHGSLLPRYRGAAPINWAVMNGDTETGVTTFMLSHEIDTGQIMFRECTPISYDDTVGTVYDRLMAIGASLVTRTVDAIASGNVPLIPQEELINGEEMPAAPKIFKETCRIPIHASATTVRNHIRGLSPYPAATIQLIAPDGEIQLIKIFEADILPEHSTSPVGTIITDGKQSIDIVVGNGEIIRISSLQLPGKRRMTPRELLAGTKLTNDYHVE